MSDASELVRILVVDDSPEDRESYRRLLASGTRERFTVVEAECGEDGLEAVRSAEFDCLLLDYNLPDLDGLEFLREMTGKADRRDYPAVVMFTGQGNERIAVEAMKCGAQDYMVKSDITVTSLARAVYNATEKIALQRDLAAARERVQEHADDLARSNDRLQSDLEDHLADLVQLQEEAVRNERLAALGTLAGWVAHDLNNPLMGVLTHIQFASRRITSADAKTQEALERALRYARRCSEIVRDLTSYSKEGMLDRMPTGISGNIVRAVTDAVEDTEEAVAEIGAIKIVSLDDDLPSVRLDDGRLRQVLVNLIRNACHAMGGAPRRTLEIFAANTDFEVTLTVKDSGHGMSEEVCSRVFEPLFTTKRDDGGSGIGLAMCKRLIEAAGGRIQVHSTEGEGASFLITLPIAEPTQTQGPKRGYENVQVHAVSNG